MSLVVNKLSLSLGEAATTRQKATDSGMEL